MITNKNTSLNIVIGVHSHAPFQEFWNRLPKPKIALMIPCCIKCDIPMNPTKRINDTKILSKKNEIIIWIDTD